MLACAGMCVCVRGGGEAWICTCMCALVHIHVCSFIISQFSCVFLRDVCVPAVPSAVHRILGSEHVVTQALGCFVLSSCLVVFKKVLVCKHAAMQSCVCLCVCMNVYVCRRTEYVYV